MPKISGQPKPRFHLDTEVGGECYILLVFRYAGGKLKRSTGEKVSAEFWNKKTQRATMNRRDNTAHIKINNKLDEFAAVVIQIWMEFNLGDISLNDFKDEISYRMKYKARPAPTPTAAPPSFFEFIEKEFLPEQEQNAYTTRKALLSVFNHLKNYANEKRGGVLHYKDLDFRFFPDFKKWLHEPPRSHSIDTAGKTIRRVKQMLNAAHARRYHEITDFKAVRTETAKTSKIALTFDELEALYSLDLSQNEKLERVRDLFLVGAYTGLRFSDFTRIRPERIERTGGQSIITIPAKKTHQVVSIPLLPIPAAILEKYNYQTRTISNQKMNEYLKEIGQMAGMTQNIIVTTTTGGKRSEAVLPKWQLLTSHVARRSFATNFYRYGVPAVVLMKITGHTTERQFMQYIYIDGMENALHFADLMKNE